MDAKKTTKVIPADARWSPLRSVDKLSVPRAIFSCCHVETTFYSLADTRNKHVAHRLDSVIQLNRMFGGQWAWGHAGAVHGTNLAASSFDFMILHENKLPEIWAWSANERINQWAIDKIFILPYFVMGFNTVLIISKRSYWQEVQISQAT